MNKNKIKFGIIGLGHIGKRHANTILQNPACELLATCDLLDLRTLNMPDTWQHPHFNNLKDMLTAHPEIDIINVCTPNGLHAAHTLSAIEAGKHVVCEKPMALKKSDCEQIISKALEKTRHVFVVMQNRYSPPSAWLKKIVEEKIIGDVYLVQMNCFWNRDHRYYHKGGWHGTNDLDGGTLFTQFSHFIDILYWIFGDISNLNARFFNFNHQDMIAFEDSGIITFDLIKGGSGSISYSTSAWDRNLESSVTVLGSKGSVKIGGQYMDQILHCHIQDYEMPELQPTNPSNSYDGYKGSANNHAQVIQNVVETLSQSNSPKTNALEGMKIVEFIERIYQLKN
ncbi:MAG: Gfo/Idh/MocA family oxidoreductase [Candidatus Competibacteraceae bacterium]|nr:Gfo/Idh/MocA family oxidoreductase [Candidatus Competibacteraceae bacterium]